MKDSKIVDINSQPTAPLVLADNKYEGVDEVLAAGLRLSQISNAELIYLRSEVLPNTPDFQLVTGEWMFRVGRKAGDTVLHGTAPEPHNE